MTVFKIVSKEMKALPPCRTLSKEFSSNWSGILLIDGKFVKVKGFKKKIPFIYCIDYLTHDIPTGGLFLSESKSSFEKIFGELQEMSYPLRMVVGDDSGSLKSAQNMRFPGIPFQLCQTHYLENVRRTLGIRREERYLPFFLEFRSVFKRDLLKEERVGILKNLRKRYPVIILESIILDLWRHYDELFAYDGISGMSPHSNNLIESYNSHLNGRLKTVKGFESFGGGERWLNAWMLRRRVKPLTDCHGKFKSLNGKCPIEFSMKSGVDLEDIFRFLNM